MPLKNFSRKKLLIGPAGAGGIPPPGRGGGGTFMGKSPVLVKMEARWFHLPQQRYYEAELNDPKMPAKSLAIMKRQPPAYGGYNLKLICNIRDDGEFQLWLYGHEIDAHPRGHMFTELLASVRGMKCPETWTITKQRRKAPANGGPSPRGSSRRRQRSNKIVVIRFASSASTTPPTTAAKLFP